MFLRPIGENKFVLVEDNTVYDFVTNEALFSYSEVIKKLVVSEGNLYVLTTDHILYENDLVKNKDVVDFDCDEDRSIFVAKTYTCTNEFMWEGLSFKSVFLGLPRQYYFFNQVGQGFLYQEGLLISLGSTLKAFWQVTGTGDSILQDSNGVYHVNKECFDDYTDSTITRGSWILWNRKGKLFSNGFKTNLRKKIECAARSNDGSLVAVVYKGGEKECLEV